MTVLKSGYELQGWSPKNSEQYDCSEPDCEEQIPGLGQWYTPQRWYDGTLGGWNAGFYCEDSLETLYCDVLKLSFSSENNDKFNAAQGPLLTDVLDELKQNEYKEKEN